LLVHNTLDCIYKTKGSKYSKALLHTPIDTTKPPTHPTHPPTYPHRSMMHGACHRYAHKGRVWQILLEQSVFSILPYSDYKDDTPYKQHYSTYIGPLHAAYIQQRAGSRPSSGLTLE